MTKRQAILGEFEQLLLLAILRLEGNATGTGVTELLEAEADRRVSRGALYSALDRLESKGFLRWSLQSATPARGGHPARLFAVTEAGIAALRHHQTAIRNLARGLDGVLRLTDG